MAQSVCRPKGHTRCVSHNEDLKLFCEQCRDLVCVGCVATVQHKGHIFHALKEIIQSRKEDIRKFINDTEKTTFPTIDYNITSAKDTLRRETHNLDFLELEVNKQREQLKQNIDRLADDIITSFRQIKKANNEITEIYINDQEKQREDFKRRVQGCKDALQEGSLVDVYDVRDEICDVTFDSTDNPVLGSASFSRNTNVHIDQEQWIGTVDISQPECPGQVHNGQSTGHHQSSIQQSTGSRTSAWSIQSSSIQQ